MGKVPVEERVGDQPWGAQWQDGLGTQHWSATALQLQGESLVPRWLSVQSVNVKPLMPCGVFPYLLPVLLADKLSETSKAAMASPRKANCQAR